MFAKNTKLLYIPFHEVLSLALFATSLESYISTHPLTLSLSLSTQSCPFTLSYLLPGVVSLFPKESGIIPLKASCHTPSSRKEEEYKGSSSSKNDGSRRLCLSDVPLGPAAVSVCLASL